MGEVKRIINDNFLKEMKKIREDTGLADDLIVLGNLIGVSILSNKTPTRYNTKTGAPTKFSISEDTESAWNGELNRIHYDVFDSVDFIEVKKIVTIVRDKIIEEYENSYPIVVVDGNCALVVNNGTSNSYSEACHQPMISKVKLTVVKLTVKKQQ